MEPVTPRAIRPVAQPASVYFRPGYSHHQAVDTFLAAGVPDSFRGGVVFDASFDGRQEGLLATTLAHRGLEAVLDTEVMELATLGGFGRLQTRHGSRPPWSEGVVAAHTPAIYSSRESRRDLVEKIAARVQRRGYTAVLAPTHLLSTVDDPWLEVDRALTLLLREELDRLGLSRVLLYYPLAVPSRVFTDPPQRAALATALSNLPVDGVWLRVTPFGSRSGATAVSRFIAACPTFHHPQRPLVVERAGVEGLALLAFGAVGGIGSGIAAGEHFDAASSLLRAPRPPKKDEHFGPPRRIYLSELQAYLPEEKAKKLFAARGMKMLSACKDEQCCRRGAEDMLHDPRRHFMKQRLREVAALSRVPEHLRPTRYLQDVLWRAAGPLLQASKLEPALKEPQRRLEALRLVLSNLERSGTITSFSAVPQGRRLEVRKGA